MKTEQWNVKMKKIVPSEGMVLYDGTDLVNEVFMPNDSDESKWREVTQEEADKMKAEKNPKTLAGSKFRKIEELGHYDSSHSVNSFMLNDEPVWLAKADRVGLQNSLTIEKNAGKTESTMWFNDKCYTVEIDKALALLAQIELYALECYNVTAKHKNSINALTTIEEVESYNFMTGYPEQIDVKL